MFKILFVLLLSLAVVPASAATREEVGRLEKLVRERLGKPEGVVSIMVYIHDNRARRITFGTIPGSAQSILTIEYDILHRWEESDEDEALEDASGRNTAIVDVIQAIYIDIDTDGVLDLALDSVEKQEGDDVEEVGMDEANQHNFDFIIFEAIEYLTEGLPS